MGYMRHHEIIVTGLDDYVEMAHDEAVKVCGEYLGIDGEVVVSRICESPINGYRSFCVFPDGSKEGWGSSEDGDSMRDTFIRFLRAEMVYDDGSCKLDWVEVQYGDDDLETRIARDSDEHRREGQ